MSLDILQTRGEISSLNIYFLQESVEITKEVIDNNDDLTNSNNNLNAPGPSLNDEDKLEESKWLSSQLKVLLETDDKSVNSSEPKLNYTNKTILYLRNQMFSGWHGKMSIH